MTQLMAPSAPVWLEETCERLRNNDPSFCTVDLTHPRMDDVGAKIFARAMEDNTVVETLILSCYAMVDDGAYAVASIVEKSRVLRRVQLKDMRNVREISTFFERLANNQALLEVSLRHCTICPSAASSVARFLRKHPKVQELRVTDCSFTRGAFAILCQEGFQHSNLLRLYLVNDELRGEFSANLLVEMLPETTIRELVLSENELGDAGVTVLARGILQNRNTLNSLNLRSNSITETGAVALQGLLAGCSKLVALNVSNNDLGDTGVSALARGLENTSSSLQRLDLWSTGLQKIGATAVAAMLKVNNHLVELNLSFNDIGETGASNISKCLRWNKTLKRLNLRRNHVGDTGAYLVAKHVPFMLGLKELVLSKNNISTDGATALLHGLRSNVELEYLHVDEKLSGLITNEIMNYIRLNKAGRRIFRAHNTVPDALWSNVYGRISGDVETVCVVSGCSLFRFLAPCFGWVSPNPRLVLQLYQFLTEKPDVIPSGGSSIQLVSCVEKGERGGPNVDSVFDSMSSPKRKKQKWRDT